MQHTEGKKGFHTSIIKQPASFDDAVSVAEVASECALVSRPEDASDDEEGDYAASEDEPVDEEDCCG